MKQAQRQDAKQQRKLMTRRLKSFEEYEDKIENAGEETRRGKRKIEEAEREMAKEIAKAERRLSKKAGDPERRAKIEEDLRHELRKIDKDVIKKIYCIVINKDGRSSQEGMEDDVEVDTEEEDDENGPEPKRDS